MPSTALPLDEVDLGPGVRAGFTRADGGFDLSTTLGADLADVAARRSALAQWLGAPVAFAWQVHGDQVLECGGRLPPPAPEVVGVADALVTVEEGVALGVLVADCVPVLLADPRARIVATVHAGRRGLVAGVVQRALDAMCARGAVPGDVRAVVGPAACGRCYEVPPEMRQEVADVVPGTWATTRTGTAALDLPGGVARVLVSAGVAAVTRTTACTIEDASWFSHRAAAGGHPAGRFAGVVRLLP
ncbi:laccase domain-containing protein [Cellulomonas sp. APG4]|uniref:polyphenol oxidase family protein n=1 Tax=Cellulomonas sp. APG4 TaxID=1538656 RepID=UPI001379E142|nr:laccase domain-containing protein [Cellulomonas sp. APG4]